MPRDANKYKPVAPQPSSKSRSVLLKEIAALGSLKKETVNLTDAEGKESGVMVEVRELTMGDRLSVSDAATEQYTDDDGKPAIRQVNAVLFPLLLQRCCYDPESGELLWTAPDEASALPQSITAQLSAAALRVNGLAPDLPKDATPGNGSDGDAPSSTSPTNGDGSPTK